MTTRPFYTNAASTSGSGGGGGGPVPAWSLEHIQGRGPGGIGDGPVVIAPAVAYDPSLEYLVGIVQTSAPSGDSTQAQILAAGGFYFGPLWLPSPRNEVGIGNQLSVQDNWGNGYTWMGDTTGVANHGAMAFISGQSLVIPPAAPNGWLGCTLVHTPSLSYSDLYLNDPAGVFGGTYRGTGDGFACVFFILSRSAAR